MFPPTEHASISPSRLQRIIDCPGSYNFAKTVEAEEPEERSPYAEEGSMLHRAVEHKILNLPWPDHYPDLTSEQNNAVLDAYDYFVHLERACRALPGFNLHVEERVYLKQFHQCLFDCHGTADIIITTGDEIHVLDWKFGQGVPVYAMNNDQLYAYAAGACKNVETLMTYRRVVIHCIQPRLDSYDVAELSPKELLQWINGRLIPGVSAALGQDPEFCPGEKQCRWCLAKNKCRARYNAASQVAADIFKAVAQLPDEVTQQELTDLYEKSSLLTKYLKDIGAQIVSALKKGQPWPGYKLVPGRSSRKWKVPEEKVVEKLLDLGADFDEILVSKLVTPPQAEKLNRSFKKDEEFQGLIIKSEGKPTLAPESDPRPALEFRTPSEVFKEVL